jgi:hypothetical protein
MVAFAPDGRTLAAGPAPQDGKTIRLWEVATGKERQRLVGTKDFVNPLAFTPDGKTLISASADQTMQLWDLARGRQYRLFGEISASRTPFPLPPRAFAVLPDSKTLFAGGKDGAVLLWALPGLPGARPPAKPSDRQLATWWNDLGSDDATGAWKAVNAFATAGVPAAEFVRGRLLPVPAANPEAIRRIAELDSDRPEMRRQAAAELEKLGSAAEPFLRKSLRKQASAELRRAVGELLEMIEGPGYSAVRLRELRAVEALERMATPEARRVLGGLAAGAADARPTQEAKAALDRLDRLCR